MHEPGHIPGSAHWPATRPGPVVIIGNFDGVHLGHRTLIDKARQLATDMECATAAYTFDPSPAQVLRPEAQIDKLQTLEDRVASLLIAGIDHVVVEPFNAEFAAHDAKWFAQEILDNRLNASAVVVGWDFRFGKRRGGDAEVLDHWLEAPVHRMKAHAVDGQIVSSTMVRDTIKRGDVITAAQLLGRPHRARGPVVHGDHRGRLLGFPTANICSQGILLPPAGVYAVHCQFDDGPRHLGVCNLGVRPTFGDNASQLEVYVMDFGADLYDTSATVDFVARVRDELRFDGPQALIEQIGRDVESARSLLQTS
ncbi:MAG: riboflavin kinase/FMN adenylyltransferase [Kiritimatiellia bacterium]